MFGAPQRHDMHGTPNEVMLMPPASCSNAAWLAILYEQANAADLTSNCERVTSM